MGIKDFFKKIGGKIKNGLKAGYDWVRGNAVPVIGRIAKTGLNIMSNLPGVIGTIGKIGSTVINTGKAIAENVPNKEIGGKIKDGLDKAEQKLQPAVETAKGWANKGNEIANTAFNAGNNMLKAADQGVQQVKQQLPM